METKICSKCKEEKDVCEYNKITSNKSGLRSECKLCRKKQKKIFYQNNKLKILENKKKYYSENKIEIIKKSIDYRDKNRQSIKNYKKNYYSLNKTKFNEKERNRRKIDPLFKLTGNIRKRIRHFLNISGIRKINKTSEIVGCSSEYLKEYLESKFTEGMSWDKIGKDIHIDHIIPLSSAKTEEEVYGLCHYTNLQPLWAYDNLSKGDKIL
jgi:hypothetical protein